MYCWTCNDSGTIEVPLPPDDTDVVPCPHCRPEMWPNGFPGIRAGNRTIISSTGNYHKPFKYKDWSNQ